MGLILVVESSLDVIIQRMLAVRRLGRSLTLCKLGRSLTHILPYVLLVKMLGQIRLFILINSFWVLENWKSRKLSHQRKMKKPQSCPLAKQFLYFPLALVSLCL